MGLAWGIGFYFTRYLLEKHGLNSDALPKLTAGVFLTAWIGAKLFFVAVSSAHPVYQYIYNNNFWLGGGFVFYGGLIFGLAFYFIYSLWLKKFPFHQSKYLVPGIAFGHAVGRIGCFFAGCCYGSECDLPWAVKMHGEWVHPVQLYESLGLFVIGFLALNWIKQKKDNLFIITRYLLIYSLLRFIVEYMRGDKIRGIYWSDLSTSQIISLALFCASLATICYQHSAAKQRN